MIKRLPDESLKAYQVRLYRNKDAYGLTNEDIGEILNKETGNNWSESAYRKKIASYIEGWDDCAKSQIQDDDVIREIDEKMALLYKQQVKTRDKLREYRKHLRDEARIENLYDVFIETAEIVSISKPMVIDKIPDKSGKDRVAVLQVSDLHFSEIVNNFLNTYNHDVFNERMKKMTEDVIAYCELMNVEVLNVLNQGDLMNGNIHVTTRVASEEDIVFQTQYVSEKLTEMLVEFGKHVPVVNFHSVVDNHSRVNKNKKEHIEKESFARFIPWYVEARLKDVENVHVVHNKINGFDEYEIGVFDIYDEKAIFVHGHLDSVKTMVADLAMMVRVFPIAVFTGHLHRNYEDEINDIDLIMNPSGIGSGEYSKNIRKTSKPRQKMTFFEQNDGKTERIGSFFVNF